MCRIHGLGFLGRDRKERRVKCLEVRLHEMSMSLLDAAQSVGVWVVEAVDIVSVLGDFAPRRMASRQHLPEAFRVRTATWPTEGEADDGYGHGRGRWGRVYELARHFDGHREAGRPAGW